MKLWTIHLLTCFGLCGAVAAQVPQKKGELSVSDREYWRQILKWPDACERGFRESIEHYPPSGLTIDSLGRSEYLVNIRCSGGVSLFMYYREKPRPFWRLLKFKEYDLAHGSPQSAYSTVSSLVAVFDYHRNVLSIIWKSDAKEFTCIVHSYRMNHARPVFLNKETGSCGIRNWAPPNKSLDASRASAFRMKLY